MCVPRILGVSLYIYKQICIYIFLPLAPLLGSSLLYWSTGLVTQFLDRSQAVGLLGRVISSSQDLYLNKGQHKHRKMRTHKASMTKAGFEPASKASELQTAQLPRPATYAYIDLHKYTHTCMHACIRTYIYIHTYIHTYIHYCFI
jgi:hypothetical protein